MTDPEENSAPDFYLAPSVSTLWDRTLAESYAGLAPTDAPEAAYVIDYRHPLEPQLLLIEKHAKTTQSALVRRKLVPPIPKSRLREEVYPDYLRILDAMAAGESRTTMKNVLLASVPDTAPDHHASKRLRNMITSASRLRDSDFRHLPWLGVRPRTYNP